MKDRINMSFLGGGVRIVEFLYNEAIIHIKFDFCFQWFRKIYDTCPMELFFFSIFRNSKQTFCAC